MGQHCVFAGSSAGSRLLWPCSLSAVISSLSSLSILCRVGIVILLLEVHCPHTSSSSSGKAGKRMQQRQVKNCSLVFRGSFLIIRGASKHCRKQNLQCFLWLMRLWSVLCGVTMHLTSHVSYCFIIVHTFKAQCAPHRPPMRETLCCEFSSCLGKQLWCENV